MTSGVKPGLSYEAEELAYYAEYGRAMAAWANVEAALFFVADIFFGEGTPRNMFAIGFTGIQGFHSKLQFVDLAVTRGITAIQIVDEQGRQIADGRAIFKDTWDTLVQALDTLSTKRNHLAHYVTVPFRDNPKEGRRIALCPWRGSKSAPKDKPPKGSYTVKKLICTSREFDRMRLQLLNFAHQLCKLPAPHAISGKPEDDLPTTQQIADQMHEALGHLRVSAKERKRRESETNALSSLEVEIHVKPTETHDAESGGRTAENAGDPADAARPEGKG